MSEKDKITKDKIKERFDNLSDNELIFAKFSVKYGGYTIYELGDLLNGNNPVKKIEKAAKILSRKYNQPTDGIRNVGVTEHQVRLDVSHIKEPRHGTNSYRGSWVVILYERSNDMFYIEYFTGGKNGRSDDVKKIESNKVTSNDLVSITNEFL